MNLNLPKGNGVDEDFGFRTEKSVLWERLQNLLLGCSILFWPLASWFRRDRSFDSSTTFLFILNLIVGLLLVVRQPVRRRGSPRAILLSLPSVGVGVLTFQLAPSLSDWPTLARGILAVGVLLAIWAFLTLGRNFAVLPALRDVVTSGPYRFIRHPAYAGQLLIAAACFAAQPSLLTMTPFALSLPFALIRIHVEEPLLLTSPTYIEYTKTVPWRLLPRVW
ncbi:MAG: isoprenylcysteine carboxylmethyltransferase family protein [Planctomycetaceae bacterium]